MFEDTLYHTPIAESRLLHTLGNLPSRIMSKAGRYQVSKIQNRSSKASVKEKSNSNKTHNKQSEIGYIEERGQHSTLHKIKQSEASRGKTKGPSPSWNENTLFIVANSPLSSWVSELYTGLFYSTLVLQNHPSTTNLPRNSITCTLPQQSVSFTTDRKRRCRTLLRWYFNHIKHASLYFYNADAEHLLLIKPQPQLELHLWHLSKNHQDGHWLQ